MGGWTIVVPHREAARIPEYVYGQPHPLLAGHVLTYTATDYEHAEPTQWRMAPLAAVLVTFSLEMPDRSPGTGPVIPASAVIGLRDRPITFEQPAGRVRGITVGLTPIGAHALLGMPPKEYTNASVSLTDVLGDRVGLLIEQLAEAPTWAARFRLLDAQFMARLRDGPELARPVRAAWHRLVTSGGRLRIGTLADEIGWTRQHLATRFSQDFGLSPKTVARISRLHQAAMMMVEPSAAPWSQIALDCGYADQAHLNRDFRALTGSTPTEYVPVAMPRFIPAGDNDR
jgi:AraC-like DNA-binding protein